MRKIELWQCEICKERYDSEEAARRCETQGKATKFPIGCLLGDHYDGRYTEITFAVAENALREHYNDVGLWACRDNCHGDGLDDDLCGNSSYTHTLGPAARLNPEHPTFKRMVAYLEGKKIPVTVWDGEKAIPLADYLHSLELDGV